MASNIFLCADRMTRLNNIIANIKKSIKSTDLSERTYILVPEQTTHETTKYIAGKLGPSGTAAVEVIGFKQLTQLVLDNCGGKTKRMDEGGQILTMANCIYTKQKELKWLTTPQMSQIESILEFRTKLEQQRGKDAVTMPMLLEAAKKSKNETLAAKLEDIAILIEEYDSQCLKNEELDPEEELIEILDFIGKKPLFFANTKWFVEGFISLDIKETNVIAAIMQYAKSVTAYFPCADQDYANPASVPVLNALETFMDATHTNIEVHILAPAWKQYGALEYVKENICASCPPVANQMPHANKAVKVYCDDTMHNEITHVAEAIMVAARKGDSYNQHSLVLCDFDKYAPAVRSLFKQYGIPVFLASQKPDLAQDPTMAALDNALYCATRGMQREDVLCFLKTRMVKGLDNDAIISIANFATTWNLHGKGWEPADNRWNLNPEGFGKEMTHETQVELARINECRSVAVQPLLALRDSFGEAKTVGDYILGLSEFMDAIQFAESVQEVIDDLYEDGLNQRAEHISQVYGNIVHALEQMHGALGNTVASTAEFIKLWHLVTRAYKIATIPTMLDQVPVYSMYDAAFTSSDVRYILGAVDGTFPGTAGESTIIDDNELKQLSDNGADLPWGPESRACKELSQISIAVNGANSRLVLAYNTAGGDTASSLVDRVTEMLPDIKKTTGVTSISKIRRADLCTPKMAGTLLARASTCDGYEDLAMALSTVNNDTLQAESSVMMDQIAWKLHDLEATDVQNRYGQEISLSATKADVWSSCRYEHFLKYGLQLKEPPSGKMTAPIFGSFAHAVLEDTLKEIHHHHSFETITEKEILTIGMNHMKNYAETKLKNLENQPERFIFLYKRNCREIQNILLNVCQELRGSKFRPTAFEYKIGGEDADTAPIQIHGEKGKGKYMGIVDRMDTCVVGGADYFRITDYKTGKTSELDLTAILNGQSMQLPLYQAALQKRLTTSQPGGVKPAGMMYVPAKDELVAVDIKEKEDKITEAKRKKLVRHGLLVNEKEVLLAMDDKLTEGSPKFLPVRVKADGSITGDICSPAQMQTLGKFVDKKLGDILDGILSGAITPNPVSHGQDRNACTYCPAAGTCNKELCGTTYRYQKKKNNEDAWAEITAFVDAS